MDPLLRIRSLHLCGYMQSYMRWHCPDAPPTCMRVGGASGYNSTWRWHGEETAKVVVSAMDDVLSIDDVIMMSLALQSNVWLRVIVINTCVGEGLT